MDNLNFIYNVHNNSKGNETKFKLNISNAPLANAKKGTLAYYAPWGNVVMFYKDFGSANGLYELGSCIDGCENISNMSGKLEIK